MDRRRGKVLSSRRLPSMSLRQCCTSWSLTRARSIFVKRDADFLLSMLASGRPTQRDGSTWNMASAWWLIISMDPVSSTSATASTAAAK